MMSKWFVYGIHIGGWDLKASDPVQFHRGSARWIAWTIWANVIKHYPYDLSVGGPHWVHAAHP